MNDPDLLALAESEFTEVVNQAFKSYSSLLALSRSPLAKSSLAAPALVLDEVAPSADDLGRAVRVMLRWAVSRLAPATPRYPLGEVRPLDDATWVDPSWWRYNILRHRYLEPIHPDEFFEGGGRVDTLLARMGLPSRDALFDERSRAIRDVASLLRKRLQDRPGGRELQRRAVEAVFLSLGDRPGARELLGMAATFRTVFPRALLLEMARAEQMTDPDADLDYLVSQRLLAEGDAGENLLISSALREYLHIRQRKPVLARRHLWAAEHFRQEGGVLESVWHLQTANRADQAAALLVQEYDRPAADPQPDELLEALRRFHPARLDGSYWFQIQELLGAILLRRGDREGALAACRGALQAATSPAQEARAYHGLGAVHQEQDPKLALGYYREAEKRLPPGNPFWPDLHARLGYFHLALRQPKQAQEHLQQALRGLPSDEKSIRASVHDALAVIDSQVGRHQEALAHAQRALVLREARGVLREIADSYVNLGQIHSRMEELDRAITMLQRALRMHRRTGIGLKLATTLNDLGVVLSRSGQHREAVEYLMESLEIGQELELPTREATSHHNLAHAYSELGDPEQAQQHWRAAWSLARQLGLETLAEKLTRMRARHSILQEIDAAQAEQQRPLQQEERKVLRMLRSQGRITSRDVTAALGISRATAKRILSGLTEGGRLERIGRGRATAYRPTGLAGRGQPQPDSGEGSTGHPTEPAALQIAREDGQVTVRALVERAGISRATAKRILVGLVQGNRLARRGQGRGTRYVLAELEPED